MKAITEALVVKCDLLEFDPAGETSVWIRQARYGEEARRRELFSRTKIQRGSDGVTEIYEWPPDLDVLECWLTFADANLVEEVPVRKDDKVVGKEQRQMFRPGMNETEFRAQYRKLPHELCDEWLLQVREVNPHWGWGTDEVRKN